MDEADANRRADELIDALRELDPLDRLPRTGWLLRGIQPAESIASHSWAVALTAMLITDALREAGQTVDGERVLRLAILHDAPEAATGDVPMPHKARGLKAALARADEAVLRDLLPERYVDEWLHADAGESLEARIVKAADKIQMMVKALVYGEHGWTNLEDFWVNPGNFRDRGLPFARRVFERICARAGRELPSGERPG